MATVQPAPAYEWRTVLRHRWPLRWMHWINLACMLALVGSGLQVFNAHPALYWGEVSDFARPLFAPGDFPGWATIPGYQSLAMGRRADRSEEHTSELQSLMRISYAVFCLKKKKNTILEESGSETV